MQSDKLKELDLVTDEIIIDMHHIKNMIGDLSIRLNKIDFELSCQSSNLVSIHKKVQSLDERIYTLEIK